MDKLDTTLHAEAREVLKQQIEAVGFISKCDQRRNAMQRRLKDKEEYPDLIHVTFPPDSQGNPDPHNGPVTKWLEARYVQLMSPVDMCARYGDHAYGIYTVWGADGGERLWGDTVIWLMHKNSISEHMDAFYESARFYGIGLDEYMGHYLGKFYVFDLKSEYCTVLDEIGVKETAKLVDKYDFLSEKERKLLYAGRDLIDLLGPLSQMKSMKECQFNLNKEELHRHVADRAIAVAINSAKLGMKSQMETLSKKDRTDIPPKLPRTLESVGARFNEDSDDEEESEAASEESLREEDD